ncbi:uncharacterized protein LOC124163580 isoform X1 [Ischnura elegans]|uniref:uncharacterized protein LOC124163580 isoform X1 n=1 Tax=Ischnura elegans TaxID=197161 RepID=UPI001ED88C7C|nr:uncharacterized protein LOC124163580 isoform X1 [Ischnura elegans]
MPKKRSEIWNHFTSEDNRAAKCGYCHKILSLVGGSTGNLMRHLRLKHPDLDIQFGQGIILEQQQLESGSLSPKAEISIAEILISKLGSCSSTTFDLDVGENTKNYCKPWSLQYSMSNSEGERKKVGDDSDVVECMSSQQSQDVKASHHSQVSSLRKRKLESTSGKDTTSVRTSMAYEDLVKLVCSNSKGNSTDDNFDLVGRNVAMKLRTMEATQKAIAERLIGEILFQGQMEMLAINTTITTPNTNNMTTSTPLRSIVINAASSLQARRETPDPQKTTYIITPHDNSES